MTYLNIVNNVLRRLREEEVTTVNETTYSTMVGDFINDAKTLVEESTDWSALRKTINVTPGFAIGDVWSSGGYGVLSGSGDDVKVLSAYIASEKTRLEYQTKEWFLDTVDLGDSLKGAPLYYTFNGLNDDGDTQVRVYPAADKSYSIVFNVIKRQPELTSDSTNLIIPSKPVIHLAIALLARERGETGGTSTPEYFTIANKYLSDAIAIDAAKHPEEMIFRTI